VREGEGRRGEHGEEDKERGETDRCLRCRPLRPAFSNANLGLLSLCYQLEPMARLREPVLRGLTDSVPHLLSKSRSICLHEDVCGRMA
jgi:hypothetical protein